MTVGTSKEISFSEFLKDDAIRPEQTVEVALEIEKKETIQYRFPVTSGASENELKDYWRILRNYFRTGENPAHLSAKGFRPVLLASYLENDAFKTDYPLFLSETDTSEHASFSDFLNKTFSNTFTEGEASILQKYLPGIEASVKKYVDENKGFCSLNPALTYAFDELGNIIIKGEDAESFISSIEKLKAAMPKKGRLLGFSGQAPVLLLVHVLKNRFYRKKKSFASEIKRLKSGLNDLLVVEKEKGEGGRDLGLDFASSMIEFAKLKTLMPESASEPMPGKRFDRITNCINMFDLADELLLKNDAIVYISESLAQNADYNWIELLKGLDLRVTSPGNSCNIATGGFSLHIQNIASLIAAVRIAKLELQQKYDEAIHDDYFKGFNWHYFSEEESAVCSPVILIEETENLAGSELPHFSELLASNIPVKVLAINSQQAK